MESERVGGSDDQSRGWWMINRAKGLEGVDKSWKSLRKLQKKYGMMGRKRCKEVEVKW